jgi:hypothetical protein
MLDSAPELNSLIRKNPGKFGYISIQLLAGEHSYLYLLPLVLALSLDFNLSNLI